VVRWLNAIDDSVVHENSVSCSIRLRVRCDCRLGFDQVDML
jgi:hypothetical protein